MATINIKDLPTNSSPADTDAVHVTQSNTDKKLLLSALKTFFQGLFTSSAAAMATDEIVVGADTNRGVKKSGVAISTVVKNTTGDATAIGNILVAAGTDRSAKDSGIGIASGAAAGMVLVATATANNSATIDFTLDTSKYDHFVLFGQSIISDTAGAYPAIRLSAGGVYDATAAHYAHHTWRWTTAGYAAGGSDSADKILLMDGETVGTSANKQHDFSLEVYSPSVGRTRLTWHINGYWESAQYVDAVGGGTFLYGSSAKDGIRYFPSSGNIVSGKFYLYGYRKA